MAGDLDRAYLAGLPADQRAGLERVNGPGLAALRGYLTSGEVVAFLGAGASAPLYPLWAGLIGELVDAAAGWLTPAQAATCRALASSSPDAVVEIVRRSLGAGMFREVLRQVLRARTDPQTGRSWTDVQELVCRCAFRGVVTTNYDPGIVNARMRVRPGVSATGFTTWEDELGLDRWRTGDVFGEDELPVLFAHGQHNRPDTIVLATTEYRRAYAGKLPHVLARLMDGHVCWIGFSFADQRITAILREIGEQTGTRVNPGAAPRHVAVMAWDPAGQGMTRRSWRSGRRSNTAPRSSSTPHPAGTIPRSRSSWRCWPILGSRPRWTCLPGPPPQQPDRDPARRGAGRMSRCGGCRRRIRWRISPAGPRSWPGWTGGPPTRVCAWQG